MNIIKLIFLAVIIAVLLGPIFLVFAQEAELEVTYPAFPGVTPPQRQPVFLPDYITYVYRFAVIASGIIAFLAVIAGGFRYLVSTGNPAQMKDARNQILMAAIGLIIILGSYVVLNEINPDLVSLEPPVPNFIVGDGIILYTDTNCGDGSDGHPGLYKEVPEGIEYQIIKGSQSITSMDVNSFWTFEKAPQLANIEFLTNSECDGSAQPGYSFSPQNENTCVATGGLQNVQCVKMTRKIPGVWLFNYENGDPENPDVDKGSFKVFQQDWSKLPDELRGEIKTIALVPDEERHIRYGVILHQKTGSRQEKKGWAHLYLPSGSGITIFTGDEIENFNGQSITVFEVNPHASDRAITLYENADYKCQPDDEGLCQEAFLRYTWGDMEEITGMSSDLAKAIVLKENDSDYRWWDDSEAHEIAICNDVWAGNWIGHITWRTGGCFRGVSAIKFEEGSSYLAILYNSDAGQLAPDGRGDAPAIVIDGSVRNLGTYDFNERTGIIFVIKVMR